MRRTIRHLIRKLSHSPLFTLVSVLTLALGIGATSAIFSVVHGVLLKPLPFDEPERLVGVWHAAPGLGFEALNQSPALHFTYREENRVFEDVGMWDNSGVTVTGVAEPERLDAMRVTDGTLTLLGVRPHLGRVFTLEDDTPGSPETVILGHGYWQRRFGSDPGAVGRTIVVDGRAREIIGVMPAGLRFLRYDPAIYLPFRFERSELFIGNFSYQGIARLKPGITIDEANTDITRMVALAPEKFPFPSGLSMATFEEAKFGPNVRPLMQDVVGDVGRTLWVLLGTVGIVLVIACANVANLFLVRAESRQRELALRTALGADRTRIAMELLLESVTLGVLGGLAGLGIAYGAIRLLLAMGPESLPRLEAITLDSTVLLFTLLISIAAGIFFGLVPLLRYSRPDTVGALKEGGRSASDGKEKHRTRGFLVVSQIALALVLLIGSGLMIRSFQALRRVQPGFERPSEVLTLRVSIPEAIIADQEEVARAHERILRDIQEIPGVVSAGMSSSITMDGWDSNDPVFVEDFPMQEEKLPPIRRFKWISPGYFETMGNPLIAGRSIDWTDVYQKANVVVVTRNFAEEYWESAAVAVGKRVRATPNDRWREIVGVVGNVHDDGVDQGATPVMFWPMLVQNFWEDGLLTMRSMAYAIRSPRIDDIGFLPHVQEAVWAQSPDLPLASVRTLAELVDDSMARTSFTLVMLGIASAVALVLGAVGLYGVISYGVSQRTREIGVRMALGAHRGNVSLMFLRHAAGLAGIGILIGLAAAFALTRLMSALLFNVNPADPMTYGSLSLLLLGIALLASYIPARRAASVSPTVALRWE